MIEFQSTPNSNDDINYDNAQLWFHAGFDIVPLVSLHVAGKIAGHLRPESKARCAAVADSTFAAAVEDGASNLNLPEKVI